MALQVPLQTSPSVKLESGSEVQYGATNVQPGKDVVTDDIARLSKAQSEFGLTLNKIDNELSDAEAKEHANNYATDLNALGNEYSNLKGVNAVGTVEVDGKQVPIFEHYQSRAKALHDSYAEKASSGTVRSIFGSKASVYTRSFINDITKHSLTQQRLYNENETSKEIEISKNNAITNFESWNDPNGEFRKSYAIGIAKIQEQAVLKGWNLDPEAEDANGNKIGISSQYYEAVETYNMEIMKAVYKGLTDKKDFTGAENFLKSLDPSGESKDINEALKKVTAKHIEHNKGKCVDAIISNNGDQNDGRFSSQFDALQCLSSSNFHNNGIGGSVVDGENSNEIDITDRTQSENRETLDQRRSTSKFYSSESSLKGTLIPQHQPIHLFAIQKLGVKKADSLYTKAKSSVDYDKERFKNDREYAAEINGKIIDKYNELIIEASVERYGNKEIPKLKEQIAELENTPDVYVPRIDGGLGPIPGSKRYELMLQDAAKNKKLIELKEKLKKAEAGNPKYEEKIANDLEILTNNINYNFSSEEETIKIDPITGLQPIEVLKAKLKATITDPKELATATKDLEIKYNKIKTEREATYNQALEKAQEIAFAEPNGYENLAAHNIDIDSFTKEDQEILRNGPPEESNVDTEVELIDNPQQLRDNLNAYRPSLSATQYLKLKQYSESLKNENNYVEATGNVQMLKATLSRNDLGHLWQSDKKKDKAQYALIHDAWLAEINARQITKGNVKLTRGEKLDALNFVLMDKVNVDTGWFDKKNVNYYLVDQDRLQDVYVDVTPTKGPYKGKEERVFISKIDPDVLTLIKASLRRAGKTVSQENIADYYLQKGRPKDVAAAHAYKEEE